MQKSLRCFLILFGLVAFTGSAMAENKPSKPQLTEQDINKFMKTYPKLLADLKELGGGYSMLDNPAAVQAAVANADVKKVLAKYEWSGEELLTKLTAIAGAFGAAKFDAELANMPEEQRAMVKSLMGAQMPKLLAVHPQDVALVKKHMAKLEAFFTDY